MDVTQTTSPLGGGPSATAQGSAALTTDFETFLRLMTTQLEFQDPLNPVDSTEYLSQLASFSAVEQQTRTNKILTAMQSSFNMFGMAQIASWVGSEARAQMPAMVEDGGAVTLYPQIPVKADQSVLLVRDGDGKLVSRVDIAVNATEFEWEPKDATGNPLPDGMYSLSLENHADGVEIDPTGVELYGRITEVQGLEGEMVLVMEGGRKVASTAITALRGG
ncbi:flagellar hook capping FlgD N-terminal domain-containing protein [Gemmobacter serpentinus]|uniref:flagellar hook capping FlgD N-terminal domain-containing protein n=1 Tax=Gemmobacter serpentinus TaxID=2652247 RepID=UPI00124F2F63|nr:flagellar hook capping FlgD N-terminal domain-containing protein [Gemmobacter serpentinus]